MSKEHSIGIFGVGPSSIAAIDRLGPSSIVFQRSDQKPFPQRSVYTTTTGYERLFEAHVPPEMLHPMREIRLVTSRGTDFTVPTQPGYFMVDFPGVMNGWNHTARERAARVEVLPPNIRREDIQVTENDGTVTLSIQGGKYEFDTLVDASGTQALIASQIEGKRKDENFFAEYVCGGTFPGEVPEGQMILVTGPGVGTSWVNKSVYQGPHGEPLVDVVFSGLGYSSHYAQFRNGDGRERLNNLVKFMQTVPGVKLDPQPTEVYYGLIRGQKTPKPKSQTIFAVGEAGGTAKPVSGESFNRALEAGDIAAETIAQGGDPADYLRTFYRRHSLEDFTLASGLLRVNSQMKGYGGIAIDQLGERIKQGEVDASDIDQFESFYIDGKVSPSFVVKLLLDTTFRQRLVRITKKLIEVKLQPWKMHTPSEYPFPPLRNDS